ncbi:MAG: hypothetical protein KatS3mg004_2631 [Bryobacteraceae bacterium]|nr:MAG: hypothetical protein KatS3mg004_2631 [Bryobacteraceae bacterium]
MGDSSQAGVPHWCTVQGQRFRFGHARVAQSPHDSGLCVSGPTRGRRMGLRKGGALRNRIQPAGSRSDGLNIAGTPQKNAWARPNGESAATVARAPAAAHTRVNLRRTPSLPNERRQHARLHSQLIAGGWVRWQISPGNASCPSASSNLRRTLSWSAEVSRSAVSPCSTRCQSRRHLHGTGANDQAAVQTTDCVSALGSDPAEVPRACQGSCQQPRTDLSGTICAEPPVDQPPVRSCAVHQRREDSSRRSRGGASRPASTRLMVSRSHRLNARPDCFRLEK